MSNKFEDLLKGRAIEELTPIEVQEIIDQLNANELEQFERKIVAKKSKAPTKRMKEAEDIVNAAIMKGLRR